MWNDKRKSDTILIDAKHFETTTCCIHAVIMHHYGALVDRISLSTKTTLVIAYGGCTSMRSVQAVGVPLTTVAAVSNAVLEIIPVNHGPRSEQFCRFSILDGQLHIFALSNNQQAT